MPLRVIVLPTIDKDARWQTADSRQKAVPMGTGHRILVIDDDAIFVKATAAVLESHGYHVDTASDGEEGMAKMVEHRPDLVLLDVMMTWPLEGVSVSRDMLARRELRNVPIIMVTSIRNSEFRAALPRGEFLHINSWLDKPCSPSDLVSEVAATLAQRQEQRGDLDEGAA